MDKPKGGRGIRAPYESTHVRVPVPIKDRVEELIDVYRMGGLEGLELADKLAEEDHRLANEYKVKLLTGNSGEGNNSLTSIDEALEAAKKILRSKQSKTSSIAKLLTTIYKVEVTESDLID